MFSFENRTFIDSVWQNFTMLDAPVQKNWQPYFATLQNERTKREIEVQKKELRSFFKSNGAYLIPFIQNSISLLGSDHPEKQGICQSAAIELKEFQHTSDPQLVQYFQKLYATRIGYEYAHCSKDIQKFIDDTIETKELIIAESETKKALETIAYATLFERFLQKRYVGQKRFSIEGAEIAVVVLEGFIHGFAEDKGEECVLAMAHRGRLNVMANVLGKDLIDLFCEFEQPLRENISSGDVKYHKGYIGNKVYDDHTVHVRLLPNPSHLESINPVLHGYVRARLDEQKEQKRILGIVVHGDAAFSGEGVVYETFQLSKLPGYTAHGIIHIVINNHIGFTTSPCNARSTIECTDIAKSFGYPILHVSQDDPEAALYAQKLAYDIQKKFSIDVILNLHCHRKHGHNESDEPSYTQPIEYALLQEKGDTYENLLKTQNPENSRELQNKAEQYEEMLNMLYEKAKKREKRVFFTMPASHQDEPLYVCPDIEELRTIAKKIFSIPEHINIHPKIQAHFSKKLSEIMNSSDAHIDFATAELLAFGLLAHRGISIRMSGQDSGRGTFSQRHAVLYGKSNRTQYSIFHPLGTSVDIIDSPLSEFAVLGFEFGYSLANKTSLVLWEAQFGDFANCAQVILDQYIAASEEKWHENSRITLLLPHGYEGQGPEHSSARIERFLTLAARANITIANPTTPKQYFHLLLRQAYMTHPRPLVIFTPKALLRNPRCYSTLASLGDSGFLPYISTIKESDKIVLICQGKIYYDLQAEIVKRNIDHYGFLCIARLYPLDVEKIIEEIKHYKNIQEVIFVQEEPLNMGAWPYIQQTIWPKLPNTLKKAFFARPMRTSSATGSATIHDVESKTLFDAICNEERQ